MNEEFHVWVSVCVILTSTSDDHFQYICLNPVHCNIETTNLDRNKNHLSRVYIIPPSIHIIISSNLFTCFQLSIVHPFCSLKQLPTWISCRQW